MNNIKIAIFPIERRTAALARHCASLRGDEPVCLLAPNHKNMEGRDLSEMDGGSYAGIVLYSGSREQLEQCSLAYFYNSKLVTNNRVYEELIEYARQCGSEVVIDRSLAVRLGLGNVEPEADFQDEYPSDELLEPDVPVIAVYSSGEFTDQANVELSIREYFISQGYKTAQIGTEDYSRILGFSAVPSFVTAEGPDMQTRIVRLNHYINRIVKEENADLFILGVPDAIMKYNNKVLNGMGILPFIMSNAVTADIGVLCMYQNSYKKEYFDEMMLYGKYHMNCPLSYFNIANARLLDEDAYTNKQLDYLLLDHNVVMAETDMEMGADEFVVFNSHTEDSADYAYWKMEEELAENAACM